MTPSAAPNPSKHHRCPGESISHAVWRYSRFAFSHRNVEERLFVRGVIVSDAAIRTWCRKLGQPYAHARRRRRPRPGDTWHLDAVCITSNTKRHDLWRAVDQDGNGREILVPRRRNTQAAKPCFRTLLKGFTSVPRVIITEKRKSDGAAKCEIMPGVEYRPRRYRNNRAEHSHQPTRQRERRM